MALADVKTPQACMAHVHAHRTLWRISEPTACIPLRGPLPPYDLPGQKQECTIGAALCAVDASILTMSIGATSKPHSLPKSSLIGHATHPSQLKKDLSQYIPLHGHTCPGLQAYLSPMKDLLGVTFAVQHWNSTYTAHTPHMNLELISTSLTYLRI